MQGAQAAGPSEAARPASAQRWRQLADDLQHAPLGRPIRISSSESDHGLEAQVWALIEQPWPQVRAAFMDPGEWCGMLLLHINNRRCEVRRVEGGSRLSLGVVRRYDKPVDEAFDLDFAHQVQVDNEQQLAVQLAADEGPLGTSHHRVRLEAMPVGERRVLLHFTYGYEHNMMARVATSAYLATFGSAKRGFTVVGQAPDSGPVHIRGMRGLMERNAMRYYLALEAYLDGSQAPAGERFEARLRHWFDGVERYPLQLREVDFDTYAALKRADRQRGAPPPR